MIPLDYVVISPEYLYHMANMIRSNVGSIFSIALYLFIAVLSLYVLINIISFFAK